MGNTVMVGTKDGLRELNGTGGVSLGGHEVRALTRYEQGWMSIVDGREVWRSAQGGQWERVATLDGLRANCIMPTRAGLLVGTSEAHVYALRGASLEPVRGFDEAPERDTWFTPWGGPPDVRSMTADASGAVFANVHVGGVARSSDGAASWEPTIDIRADVHQVLSDPGSGLVLAASARGLAVSSDDGGTWRFETEGLHGGYLRAVAAADGNVFVTASTGHDSSKAAVYRRSLDSGGPFQRCQSGLPEWFPSNIDTFCLGASGSAVAFGTSEGQVFLSSDRGESRSPVAGDLPPVLCVALP